MVDDIYFFNKNENSLKNKAYDLKLKHALFQKINLPLSINIKSDVIKKILSNYENLESLRYILPNECIYMIEKKGFYKKSINV
jgi:BioD-like phosphotransacetylase family protein